MPTKNEHLLKYANELHDNAIQICRDIVRLQDEFGLQTTECFTLAAEHVMDTYRHSLKRYIRLVLRRKATMFQHDRAKILLERLDGSFQEVAQRDFADVYWAKLKSNAV